MIVPLAYLLGFVIAAKFNFKTIPEEVGTNKVLLATLFYPVNMACFLLNLPLMFLGINLQFQTALILNKKEQSLMTDKRQKELSDILDKLLEEVEENEEK